MFQTGDFIMYGSTGVCQVEDIGTPHHIASDKERLYYTLRPVYGAGLIYIPVDTKVFMRPVISREEADALIRKIPDVQENQYESHNLRWLSDQYESFFRSHACEDLVQLMKTVYAKNKTLQQSGRQLGQTDQRYQKRAEELLYGEFAVALGIPYETVELYISKAIEGE